MGSCPPTFCKTAFAIATLEYFEAQKIYFFVLSQIQFPSYGGMLSSSVEEGFDSVNLD